MSETPITGIEAEQRGALKFDCIACRDAFPVRCEAHKVISATYKPFSAKLTLSLLLKKRPPAHPGPSMFSKPILEYTAPYEALELEIQEIRERARHA